MKRYMKKAVLITPILLVAMLLLSNTAIAPPDEPQAKGPPVGTNYVTFDPNPSSPCEPVEVTIAWWMDSMYATYRGPFYLKIDLEEDEEWRIHTYYPLTSDGEPPVFTYDSSEENPFTFVFTKDAPCSVGEYKLQVQILATGQDMVSEVGKSGNYHYFLVGSTGGTQTTVPEFTTIAIPVAAIIGLLFFFSHRKQRKT